MRRRGGPMGGPHMMHGGEKAKDFKGTLGKLLKYIGKYKLPLLVAVIFTVGSTVFQILGPKVMGQATTEIFNGLTSRVTGGSVNFAKIGEILLMTLALYLTGAAFNFIQGWIMSGITQKVCLRMRTEISAKINRMPMKYFESRTVGETLSRVTNDVDTLGQHLSQSVTQLLSALATIIGAIVMMLSISPMLTGVTLLVLPVSLILIAVVMKFSQKHFKNQQKYLGEVNGQIEESIGGHTVVKLFNHEEAAADGFNQNNDKLYESAWKSQSFSGLMFPVMNFIGNFGYVCIAVLGGIQAFQGKIAVGDIQAFFQYNRNLTQPLGQVAQVGNMLQSMAAAAERVFEILDEDEEQENQNALPIENARGEVSFNNVHFGYDPEKIIIGDFSADVAPGQTVAIVGPTGAGKTTMVKLLMRFYDVQSGSITVDGHDIRDYSRGSLRDNFGMVLQDAWLFSGTIMDNIRYGKLGAADDEVYAAAKAAHVHHFIKTLPGGYGEVLGEDATNISQGQRQLLTIARAILADKPILILDEATSSVDTRTEERIQKAMRNLMRGRTSFVIAHRLSTIRDADLILVMRDGDIVEQGGHRELLAQGGFYSELWQSQFEE
ncbi:MAG: ABC transporter ATP-binding protein/permease [Oscillospiraceae bacterium]|nr:ABC transporter ATP-binding protein/permease [Oscillospiraceae bacterium]